MIIKYIRLLIYTLLSKDNKYAVSYARTMLAMYLYVYMHYIAIELNTPSVIIRS